MGLSSLLLAAATVPLVSAETILGAYMLHRHGDRTPKSHSPTNLTALGAEQCVQSGVYYRSRYVEDGASVKVYGLSSDIAVPSQVTVQAPVDAVLQISAQAFLQGLYPPVGVTMSTEELANGTEVSYPLNGYQYLPVNTEAASNDHSENNEWLQEGSGCGNAMISSNSYFSSEEYLEIFDSTEGFYQDLLPVINGTFSPEEATFKNGYTIWDLINVAQIHNSSIPSSNLLTDATMTELRTLSDIHEWNLAYSDVSPIRAIAGKVLAGQILYHAEQLIKSPATTPRLGIQFGAYATFMSFFGLAQLDDYDSQFRGVVDYASSMTFEFFVEGEDEISTASTDNVKVRFLFTNGTASSANEPQVFPLFNRNENSLSFSTFQAEMDKIAVKTNEDWCVACGNSTGTCAEYADAVNAANGDSTTSSSSGDDTGSGLSAPIAGVIGALVALAVVLGVEALAMVVGGLRVVKKRKLAAENAAENKVVA